VGPPSLATVPLALETGVDCGTRTPKRQTGRRERAMLLRPRGVGVAARCDSAEQFELELGALDNLHHDGATAPQRELWCGAAALGCAAVGDTALTGQA
jgi:hypothetical protein